MPAHPRGMRTPPQGVESEQGPNAPAPSCAMPAAGPPSDDAAPTETPPMPTFDVGQQPAASVASAQPSVQQSAEELLRSVYQLMKSVQGTTDVAGRTLTQIAGVVSGAWNAIAAEQEKKGSAPISASRLVAVDHQSAPPAGGPTADPDVARALRDAANALRDAARGLHRVVELFQGMAGGAQSSGPNNQGVQAASDATQPTPARYAAEAREYAAVAEEAARGARAAAASAANAMSGATPANGDGGTIPIMTEMTW